MINFLIRVFIKLTGVIPFIFGIKPKFYYSSKQAKRDSKNLKDGAILVSNHASIFDYYTFVFHYIFKKVHTMVADIIYKRRTLTFFNNVMGNIKIDRHDPSNIIAIQKSKNLLYKRKTILIFPEGHLESKRGEVGEFKASAILLAYETNKPIIPFYTDGRYHFFHRVRFIAGEKIYLRQIINKERLDSKDIDYLINYVRNRILSLKHELEMMKKHKTQEKFSSKHWVADVAKTISLPWRIFFRSKTIYLGDKKETKQVLRNRVLIASNHTGLFDPICMLLTFFTRRIHIIAEENLWAKRFMAFAVNNSGAIKYHRDSMNRFDIKFILEAKEILEGRGAVGIYPEGHISLDSKKFEPPLMGGLAMLSLMTKTPIIPMLMSGEYAFLKSIKVGIGKPIYPTKFFDYSKNVDNKLIEEYNKYIYAEMKAVYDAIQK